MPLMQTQYQNMEWLWKLAPAVNIPQHRKSMPRNAQGLAAGTLLLKPEMRELHLRF